ncbi:putative transcriptional regulator, Crp/Fnr family [Kangiella koreensis DSM 16069]|uniref:Putative transcriptional regulator, Crp/Fnr family n=1 Tax=Kangiella koreensis (strain DSM 16069 / JCM 12317 / KCTC 12182 / SW-125) TaxID=523791 RepID=C7R7S3_KANKD|nr:putative transcriptional regulator, Crp/Fnr family [Kangiella koreensis DSM 16069]
MFKTTDDVSNHIFSSFSVSLQKRLCTSVKQLNLAAGKTLFSTQETISYLYFPIGCVIHLIYELDEGDEVQVASLGASDVCGGAIFSGSRKSLVRAEVLHAGTAMLMPAKEALYWFHNEREFREPLLKACGRIEHHIMAKVACTRFHTIQQQLCFWLLELSDQIQNKVIDVTHEHIAGLLGVRREGISEAAHKLQLKGVIDYKRGHIKIINRKQLEQLSCECYHNLYSTN